MESKKIGVKLEPLKNTGDGKCLFNLLSLLLNGNEILAPVLRAMLFFYGAIHVTELEKWVSTMQLSLQYSTLKMKNVLQD